jgi:ABC transporter substrate binding protein
VWRQDETSRRIVLRIIRLESSVRTPTTRFSCSTRRNGGGDFAGVSGRTERDSDDRVSQREGTRRVERSYRRLYQRPAGRRLVIGRNLRIEYRWAEFKYERLQSLATDLIGKKVSVIAAVGGAHSGLALKAVTSVVPIVFVSAGDPIAFGLVSSLNRPNGNVTGISMITVALAPKRLQLLHELVRAPADMAMLANSSSPYFEQEKMDVIGLRARLGAQNYRYLQPTIPRRSKRHSHRFERGVGCFSSAEILTSMASATVSFRLPRTTRCRPSTNDASLRRLVA